MVLIQDDLAKKAGIDKKLTVGHVKAKGANIRTIKTYADAFTKDRKRSSTTIDMEQWPDNCSNSRLVS